MPNINIKTLYIDADGAKSQVSPGSTATSALTLYRGTETILQANVYSNSASTAFVSFANATGWTLNIGREHGGNASPVVIEANTASWNQTADWALCNVQAGLISVRVNTAGTLVATDLGNSTSQNYTMEFWYMANGGSDILVMSDSCYIHNSSVL